MVEIPGFALNLPSMKKTDQPDQEAVYDLLILGGGPAAMTAAVYSARKMMKVAIFTKDLGGQVGWTSQIENYMGFQLITGTELVDKFKEQVEQFEIPIATNKKGVAVRKEGALFKVELNDGSIYSGKTVIVATGKRSRPLNVPGEQELMGKGVAICATCDAPFFKDKRVLVVGGGNSAFTAGMDLLKLNAEVTLINFASGWQADEIMIESVREFGDKIHLLDNHQVVEILGDQKVTGVKLLARNSDHEFEVPADGVFIEIGLLPNSEPVRDLAELNEKGELIVDCHCSTSVEGFYGAGDVTTVPHKQIVISAGEGAKAALGAYEYLMYKGKL